MKDRGEHIMGKYFLAVILIVFFIQGCSSKKDIVVVSSDKNYSLYDVNNKETLSNNYEQMSLLDDADDKNIKTQHLNLLNFHWLHNNYGKLFSIVKKEKKYGIIDERNKFLLDAKYDSISNLYNGFFIIKKDDKYGYVNDNFEVVQEAKFLEAKEFSKDVAFVKFENNKWGCISDDMEILIEGKYDEVFPYVNSYARVISNDKWGFVDENCKVIVEPEYDFIDDFYGKYARVLLNNKTGYINKKGEEIVKPTFDFGQKFRE
jgi:hypothetical protein